jgi:hypothetical protein
MLPSMYVYVPSGFQTTTLYIFSISHTHYIPCPPRPNNISLKVQIIQLVTEQRSIASPLSDLNAPLSTVL